jgi:malate dehydrogenase (oxaloacetate-decarboxylating)(NADP+)
MPYVYTPPVGEACQKYHRLPVHTYGVYLRADDPCMGTPEGVVGHLEAHCERHGLRDVRVVIMTDGERILGLGDLGANGMGISEGKGLLYTAAAGVPPQSVLPVCVDVGTNNEDLRNDPLYSGVKSERLTGDAYRGFMDRVLRSIKAWRPRVVLQFEDFANHNAFDLLQVYSGSSLKLCCFNDDIQGTASIALSGLLAAVRASGKSFDEQRVLFLGAGEAGAGIGELIAKGLHAWCGLGMEEARRRCWFIDSKGLITSQRRDLQEHKKAFAHEFQGASGYEVGLLDAIRILRPTALIGVSTQPGSFSREALELMAEINERPIVFPLSNPTSKSECTFVEAMRHTGGRVLFASGSPFGEVDGVMPSQANNAYIFPAVGYAASLCGATEISDEAFLIAAAALSKMASDEELACGSLFPRFGTIREVSRKLAGQVAAHMCETGVGCEPDDFGAHVDRTTTPAEQWEAYTAAHMYQVPADIPSSKL